MEIYTLPPVGTAVIDEDGMRGFIYQHLGSKQNSEGRIYKWWALIRYHWNDPGYGQEKRLYCDQISPLQDNGDILCNYWDDEEWLLRDDTKELKPLNIH